MNFLRDPATAFAETASTIAKVIGGDPDAEKAEIEARAAEAQSQNAVNLEEAKSARLFVAGWRPALGWVCVFGLSWQYIGYPIFGGFYAELPKIDSSIVLVPILMTLIGARSFDKFKRIDTK